MAAGVGGGCGPLVALTTLLDRPDDDDDVRAARDASVTGPMVSGLIDGLPSWGGDAGVSGHDSPAYLPNILGFLADLVSARATTTASTPRWTACAPSNTTTAGSPPSDASPATPSRCGGRCRATPT